MGTREKDERLKAIWDSGGETYSISRLNTINQCEYQAYLHYVLNEPEESNIWAIAGGKVHDVIEGCIKGTNAPSDMKAAIEQELDDAALLGIDFPHSANGGTAIRDNWIANMTKFAEVFTTPKGKFDTEELVIFPVGNNAYMIGYIDAIRYNDDGTISIIDWKTSSQFRGNHLLEAGRQLIVYAMAMELQGHKVRDAQWCMLKYAKTIYPGAKTGKISEWRNLIKDLKTPIMTALKAAGYDKYDSNLFYSDALESNSFEPLPDKVKSLFRTTIYVRQYEITDELRKECMEYIQNGIQKFHEIQNCDGECGHRNIDDDSFFCSGLCGFRKKCKHYNDWKDRKYDSEENFDDLF